MTYFHSPTSRVTERETRSLRPNGQVRASRGCLGYRLHFLVGLNIFKRKSPARQKGPRTEILAAVCCEDRMCQALHALPQAPGLQGLRRVYRPSWRASSARTAGRAHPQGARGQSWARGTREHTSLTECLRRKRRHKPLHQKQVPTATVSRSSSFSKKGTGLQ